MTHSGVALIDPEKVFEKIHLGPGMRVADFGCGRTGHFVFPASRKVDDTGIVYAVDVIKNILESISSQSRSGGFHNVQTIWSDIEKYGKSPIPANSLDAGFFVNVVSLFVDYKTALRESVRLLKTDGYLVVVDWSKKIGMLGPDEDKMVNLEAVVNVSDELGLVVVDKFPINEYHYSIIFKKK